MPSLVTEQTTKVSAVMKKCNYLSIFVEVSRKHCNDVVYARTMDVCWYCTHTHRKKVNGVFESIDRDERPCAVAAAAVGILHTAFFVCISCDNGKEVLEEQSGVALVGVQQMRPEHIPTRRRYLNTPPPRGHYPIFIRSVFGMFLATSLPCGMRS